MRFHNKSRTSKSIPLKLLKSWKVHLIPIYYFLRLSSLSREAIDNGGSFRFADQVYSKKSFSRGVVGRILDNVLLNLKSAKAMRSRYLFSKIEIKSYIIKNFDKKEINVIAIPSGYARELFEVNEELNKEGYDTSKINWFLFDLDKNLIKDISSKKDLPANFSFIQGDAMDASKYFNKKLDIIVSLGFTDFLNEFESQIFYRNISEMLSPGGIFINSAMRKFWPSEFMLKNFAELKTVYRKREEIVSLIKSSGFKNLKAYSDRTKLSTIVVANI